jgi:hypothetical protein
MSERGQRTHLRFGSVTAAVSLLPTSGKPKAAQHETKRVLAATLSKVPTDEPTPVAEPGLRASAIDSGHPVDPLEDVAETIRDQAETAADVADRTMRNVCRDAFGTTPEALMDAAREADPPVPLPAEPLPRDLLGPMGAGEPEPEGERGADAAGLFAPTGDEAWTGPDAPPAVEQDAGPAWTGESAPAEYVPPATTVQQGVHLENGEWVDLTDRLNEIDERTKVDGLEVVATIATNAIPRERVRGATYLAGVDADTFKVLALLWRALRGCERAAAVRYTKRTAQTLGIIVARGSLQRGHEPAHLVLLELEWAQNMREPSKRVTGPIGAPVGEHEVAAAIELVEAFAGPPSAVNDLRDERLAKRAELLQLARENRLGDYVAPAVPMLSDLGDFESVADTASAMDAATSWLREHAPA